MAEAHGDHQYTLVVHQTDEYDAAVVQPEAGAAAGAPVAAGGGDAGAPDGQAAGSAAASAGAAAAAAEDGAEGEEVLDMRVRIVSDSLLDVLDSDGESAGGSMRCHWRPAPTSMQEMFSRAFLNLAERQPLPRGVELPSADQLAAVMAQASGGAAQCGVCVAKGQGMVQVIACWSWCVSELNG